MNEYTQQAEQFLIDTETTLNIVYLYTGQYFKDDTDSRDIYQFTLTNKRGSYRAKFGDSIHNTKRRIFANDCWNLYGVNNSVNELPISNNNSLNIK